MRRSLWTVPAMLLALSACDMGALTGGGIEVPRERLDSQEARERGRDLYLRHCALCHGRAADGRGVRRSALRGDPRDFTSPVWRRSVTAREVFVAIRDGVEGTSMPAWPSLDEPEIWDLTAYLLAVSEEGS